jgi:hypothetical protein
VTATLLLLAAFLCVVFVLTGLAALSDAVERVWNE